MVREVKKKTATRGGAKKVKRGPAREKGAKRGREVANVRRVKLKRVKGAPGQIVATISFVSDREFHCTNVVEVKADKKLILTVGNKDIVVNQSQVLFQRDGHMIITDYLTTKEFVATSVEEDDDGFTTFTLEDGNSLTVNTSRVKTSQYIAGEEVAEGPTTPVEEDGEEGEEGEGEDPDELDLEDPVTDERKGPLADDGDDEWSMT